MLKNFPIEEIAVPEVLNEIPQAPNKIFLRGELPSADFVRLCVVGSRKYSNYGKDAIKKLIEGLRGYSVCIVSGLALGIDSIAHESALDVGLKIIAIPGSGLNEGVLYPRSHLSLAKRILEKGGCLLSEYEPNQRADRWTFPRRNRIMAGLSKAILIVEAERKSGTMITARLATEYNRDILAIPGSIFSSVSEGPNFLIRMGATPISNSEELLEALGINVVIREQIKIPNDVNESERAILEALTEPLSRDELLELTGLDTKELSGTLTLLELRGLINESAGKIYIH